MYNTYEEIKSDIENVYRWFFDNVCAKCSKECQHNGRRVLLCSKFQELIEFFANEKTKDNIEELNHLREQYYNEILSNESFLKTVTLRARDECNKSLMILYNIPIPDIDIGLNRHWQPNEVLKIANRLKQIANDIDFTADNRGDHNEEAIRFFVLMEMIAGKRNVGKLSYLIFNII